MVYFTLVATYLIFTYTVSGQSTATSTNGNACNSSPCQNGGTCLDTQGGYVCNCDVGYTGHDCNVDLDECASMPCENGGYCMNFMGNFICNCMTGYSGNTCQIAPSTISSPMTSASPANSTVSSAVTSTVSSAPVKAQTLPVSTGCSSDPCQNRAVCMDTATGYTCRCAPGYMGNTCETEIDECASSPCLNVVKCIDQVNGFTCICKDGFNGTLCEKNIDDCAGVICQNGGTCFDLVNDYWCNCPVGYSGGHCETRLDIDDCYSNPCQHGGTCIDGHYSYTCQCDSHYKGTNCQTACHDVKADIVMLLDSSSSVGTSGFIKQLQFVASIANSFDIGPDKVNIGVVTFSTHPHLEFDLNTYHSKHSLINAIGHISYRHGQTYTDEAIDYLIRHSFTPKAGDRPDAPNIAVVITDGLSRHASSTSHEASLLHRHGVTTVAIGVGSRGDKGELYSIASSRDLVFTVANYDALHTIQSLLDHGICQAHQTYNTSTPSTTSNQYPTPTDIVTGNCEDKISYCSRYDQNVCHSYKQWASDNCAKSCRICTAQTAL